MQGTPTPAQLTADTIRRAIEALQHRHDLSPVAKSKGIASLQAALARLGPHQAKMRLSPTRRV